MDITQKLLMVLRFMFEARAISYCLCFWEWVVGKMGNNFLTYFWNWGLITIRRIRVAKSALILVVKHPKWGRRTKFLKGYKSLTLLIFSCLYFISFTYYKQADFLSKTYHDQIIVLMHFPNKKQSSTYGQTFGHVAEAFLSPTKALRKTFLTFAMLQIKVDLSKS